MDQMQDIDDMDIRFDDIVEVEARTGFWASTGQRGDGEWFAAVRAPEGDRRVITPDDRDSFATQLEARRAAIRAVREQCQEEGWESVELSVPVEWLVDAD